LGLSLSRQRWHSLSLSAYVLNTPVMKDLYSHIHHCLGLYLHYESIFGASSLLVSLSVVIHSNDKSHSPRLKGNCQSIYELFEWRNNKGKVSFFFLLQYGSFFLGNMVYQGDDDIFSPFIYERRWVSYHVRMGFLLFVFLLACIGTGKFSLFTLWELPASGEAGEWYGKYQRRSWVAIVTCLFGSSM
jgi:hypothetical protein